MNDLSYQSIEEQLVERLPVLAFAAEEYWRQEGRPGSDPGPYIFMDSVFVCYLEVLGWMPDEPRRNHLLSRALGIVEEMLRADKKVRELAAIEALEGADPAWLRRVGPFLGWRTKWWLRRHHRFWFSRHKWSDDGGRDIIDFYGVREAVARELDVDESSLPGRSDRRQDRPA